MPMCAPPLDDRSSGRAPRGSCSLPLGRGLFGDLHAPSGAIASVAGPKRPWCARLLTVSEPAPLSRAVTPVMKPLTTLEACSRPPSACSAVFAVPFSRERSAGRSGSGRPISARPPGLATSTSGMKKSSGSSGPRSAFARVRGRDGSTPVRLACGSTPARLACCVVVGHCCGRAEGPGSAWSGTGALPPPAAIHWSTLEMDARSSEVRRGMAPVRCWLQCVVMIERQDHKNFSCTM